MTVVVIFNSNNSARGFLRRWFIEPKPNVFISSISSHHAMSIMNYLQGNIEKIEYMMFSSDNSSQQFVIVDRTSQKHNKNIIKSNFIYDLTSMNKNDENLL